MVDKFHYPCSFTDGFRYFCECALRSDTAESVKSLAFEYSDGVRDLIDSGRYDVSDDFTVVFQPFLRDNYIPVLVCNTINTGRSK